MTIDDADSGATVASVWVSGIDGGLDASASLSVAPGTYDVSASPFTVANGIVGVTYDPQVTGSPATVASAQTAAVQVAYARRPGSGFLWVPNDNNGDVEGYSVETLAASTGTITPDVLLTTDGGHCDAISFDPSGRLWANVSDYALWGWTLYADGGASDPIVVNPLYADGGAMYFYTPAFQPNGDVWLTGGDSNTSVGQLELVTAAQLQASGPVVASQVITSVDVTTPSGALQSLDAPYGLIFDPDGNAWVSNYANSTLAEFPRLGDGGLDSTPMAFFYSSTSSALSGPNSVSFDLFGGMWIANWDGCSVARVAVAGITGVADIEPYAQTVLSTSGGASCSAPFNNPGYLTFDETGALWVLTGGDSTLARFAAPWSFVGPVTPTADATYATSTGVGANTGRFAFDPPMPNLGLYPSAGIYVNLPDAGAPPDAG